MQYIANDQLIYTTGKKRKSIPEDECPERTGKTEENRRDDGAKKAHQKNGLAADVIRKTAPL